MLISVLKRIYIDCKSSTLRIIDISEGFNIMSLDSFSILKREYKFLNNTLQKNRNISANMQLSKFAVYL